MKWSMKPWWTGTCRQRPASWFWTCWRSLCRYGLSTVCPDRPSVVGARDLSPQPPSVLTRVFLTPSLKTVMLSEARENILGAVLKVLLYSLGSAQSAVFLQHGLASQRALVTKVSTLQPQPRFQRGQQFIYRAPTVCRTVSCHGDTTAAGISLAWWLAPVIPELG